MSFYLITLLAHSYVRWAILAAAAAMLARSFAGWRRTRAWTDLDERLHVALVGFTDLQFTLGVALYLFASPFAQAFIADPAAAIEVSILRFFGLEHPVTMLFAVALVHIGRTRSKKASTPALRHRSIFVTTLIALVLICASIPWPGLDYGRPLLRSPATPGTTSEPPSRSSATTT
jgi:hypothetical protein